MLDIPVTPFRWDLRRREQLGRLLDGETAWTYPEFTADLRRCAVRVVALAGESDLFFVGRSPENLFDYLCGLFTDTSWQPRCHLVHLSLRDSDPDRILGEDADKMGQLRGYLRALGLEPAAIARRPLPIALVDLVASGSTFENLTALLSTWCREHRGDWAAVHRKFRYLGITRATRTSPKTIRWQQHAGWLELVPEATVKNVSVPDRLWNLLGNTSPKTTVSYYWRYWGSEEAARPGRDPEMLSALRLAVRLFDRGRSAEETESFTRMLAEQREMRDPAVRALCTELRATRRDG